VFSVHDAKRLVGVDIEDVWPERIDSKIEKKYWHCEQAAGLSTAPLAMRLREAALRNDTS
jgi:hypothetical protein